MRIICQHGFFKFYEDIVGEVSQFVSYTGLELAKFGEGWTFDQLKTMPDYSLAGKVLVAGFTATETFAGEPGDIFEANGCVYDFTQGLVVPIETITKTTKIDLVGRRFVSPGLILPGSLTAEGERVRDYSAWFSRDRASWLYSEVSFV